MTKAILFDIGDVYFHGNFKGFLENACELLNLDKNQFSTSSHSINSELYTGKMQTSGAFSEFFGVNIPEDKMKTLLDKWTETWHLNPDMQKLAFDLKSNYKVALLSNSDKYLSPLFERWCGSLDGVFLSHELGIIKPDAQIYLHAAKELGVTPYECLFVDDNSSFVEGAKIVGMDAIIFKNKIQLEEELKKRDILF